MKGVGGAGFQLGDEEVPGRKGAGQGVQPTVPHAGTH